MLSAPCAAPKPNFHFASEDAITNHALPTLVPRDENKLRDGVARLRLEAHVRGIS